MMIMMRKETKKSIFNPLCVLAAGILWGCMGLLVRSMNPCGFTSMEVVIFRAIVTSILMAIIMAIFKRDGLKVKWKDLWCFLGTGIASMVFFNFCYFSCMKYTTLSVAAILLYTAPAFLMIMSAIFFKEKFTLMKVLCLAATFVGCVLVSGGLPIPGFSGLSTVTDVTTAAPDTAIIGGADGPTAIFLAGELGKHVEESVADGVTTGIAAGVLSLPGLLLGLGAGFGYALYSVFSRFAIKRGYSSFTITTYTFWFATLGCAPFINWPHFVKTIGASTGKLPLFLLLTIMTTILAYLLYTKGLEGMENGMAGIIASIEPVMASIVGVVVFHEKLTITGIIGMVLVLGACALVSLPVKKKNVN